MLLLDIPNGAKTIIMLAAMIAVFYFFLIRPQRQQAKKEADYRNGLKKGDIAMTSGGIHVTIVSVEGATATVELAKGVRVHLQTATLQPRPDASR